MGTVSLKISCLDASPQPGDIREYPRSGKTLRKSACASRKIFSLSGGFLTRRSGSFAAKGGLYAQSRVFKLLTRIWKLTRYDVIMPVRLIPPTEAEIENQKLPAAPQWAFSRHSAFSAARKMRAYAISVERERSETQEDTGLRKPPNAERNKDSRRDIYI